MDQPVVSNGSSPNDAHSARPRQILCDSGASMIARATSDDESTSPTPTSPASGVDLDDPESPGCRRSAR